MAKQKTVTKKRLEGEEFIRAIAKLDHERQVIAAHIELLKIELKEKEREINQFLDDNVNNP